MRDLSRLASELFDVCVIGAGIYGAVIVQRLAAAGLKTAIVDKGDFCAATSANSLKILHGGLRYLQHGNIVRMRETIRARRDFMRFAPHLTRPLACVIPTFGLGLRSAWAGACASFLNNLIGADRNLGLGDDIALPPGRVISREAFLEKLPRLEATGTSGGLLWYDALADDTERLTLEYLLAARDLGAEAANYCEAERILGCDGAHIGIRAHDLETGQRFDIRAVWVVNAAGPWFDEILRRSDIPAPPTRWAKAVNIVADRALPGGCAAGVESRESYRDRDAVLKRNKRFYFFAPWRGGALIGTTYREWTGDRDALRATREDALEIVDAVNAILPRWGLRPEDVSFCHAGLLPMSDRPGEPGEPVQLAKHSLVIEHSREGGPPRLLSLRSIKYTTAPVEADKIAGIILADCGRRAMPSKAPATLPPVGLPPDLAAPLAARYGNRAGRVAAFLDDEAGRARLSDDPPLLRGEIRYFVHEELARKLADVVFRRSGLGAFRQPPRHVLDAIAEVMAEELGWDAARREEEIGAVERRYAMLPGNDSP